MTDTLFSRKEYKIRMFKFVVEIRKRQEISQN